jgi:hypothetical protein
MLKSLIFASALSLFMAGNAAASIHSWSATYSFGGVDYDVSLLEGTWDDHEDTLLLNPWWGHPDAGGLAFQVAYDGLAPVGTRFATGCDTDWSSPACVGASIYTLQIMTVPLAWNNWAAPDDYARCHPDFWAGGVVCLGGAQEPTLWAFATVAPVTAVPVPAAGWLFMSALIGLMGKKRLSRRSVH